MPVKASKSVPDGMSTVTTQLFFNGNCREAIEFYKKAFNATLVGHVAEGPDRKSVLHAMIKIGDTNLMLADVFNDNSEPGMFSHHYASLFMYVEDCDAVYKHAVASGCKVIHEMADTFWGDRMGNVSDPFGHNWGIASFKWVFTPEEIAKGQEEWMKTVM